MDAERWKRVDELLQAALRVPPAEQNEFLRSKCGDDSELIEEVRSLLASHQEAGTFLESPAIRVSELAGEMSTVDTASPPGLAGQTVGAYTLVSQIGQGGMGTVWLARRSDGRFERQAAVKFVSIALPGRAVQERFRREGSILGRLTHPHIAELLDAGITAEGQPYLILEYVDGKVIDEYCDERKLDVEARVRLFLDVLAAVAHAHANLIVHRDIKPSNVLITSNGEVKLLDFGIAKLLEGEGQAGVATLLTHESGSALTPHYAAPEQLSNQPVTTATDAYALGVLLYVLLTGQHPAGPGPHSPAELLKAVLDTEPPRPSVTAASAHDHTTAEARSTTPEKLVRQLRGDLDTILGKTLKKNPQERYGSVTALADDLRRYLKHEPIGARPDALSYRLRKYVRRHRLGVAVTSGLMLLLAVFAVLQTIELRRITRERDRADRIAEFMTGVFKVSDPMERVGSKVTAQQLLDKAAKDVHTGLAKDPETQSRMMHVMGKAYMNLGLYPEAQSLLDRGVKISEAALGQEHRNTLNIMGDLGWTLFQEGRLSEAENLQRKLLDIQKRVLGPEDHDTLGTLGNLSVTLCEEDKCSEGVKLSQEELAVKKRVLGPEAFDTLATMDNLSVMLAQSNRLAEAEKLERETLEIQFRVFGRENLGTISSMINMADIERDMGRDEEALKLYAETLDLEQRVLGPDQPETAVTRYSLACILARRGQMDEAVSNLRNAIDHGLHPRMDLGIEKDPLLSPLHNDPRFPALVAYAKQVAAKKTN